jgi:hypothetical protein
MHVVLCEHGYQAIGCSAGRAYRCVEIENIICEELARLVHNRDLASCSQAGVDPQHGDGSSRRGKQQILQVVAEDLDGVGVGSLLQLEADLALDRCAEKTLPAVVDCQFELRRPVSVGAQDARTEQVGRAEWIDFDEEVEN